MFEILVNFRAHQFLKRCFRQGSFILCRKKLCDVASLQNADSELPMPQPKIVIVGAGMAGLSAANHLIKNGFKNILINEASDRFGGRVWSRRLRDCICELGAHCINFSKSSDSLYQLAKEGGLLHEIIQEPTKYYMTNKGEVINNQLASEAKLVFSTLITGSKQKALSKNVASSKYFLQEECKSAAKRMFISQAHVAERLFEAFRKDLVSFIGCDLSMMSVTHLEKIAQFYSNPVCINDGLAAIFRKLARNIKTHQVRYGKPITHIRWSNLQDNELPFVRSADGDKSAADHIICTIPLGSLKIFASTMFDPPLPKNKLDAIKKLGVGYPGKMFLQYSKDIKQWFKGTIKPLWSFDSQSMETDWMYDITEICLVPGSNTVLEVKIGGPSNEEAERCNDVAVMERVTSILKTFLSNNKIPYPQAIVRSFWSTDPKFLGGQSYISIYSGEPHIKNISFPLLNQRGSNSPVLLFAGDATSWDDFGTLEGARRSGIREAQRIINYHMNNFDTGFE